GSRGQDDRRHVAASRRTSPRPRSARSGDTTCPAQGTEAFDAADTHAVAGTQEVERLSMIQHISAVTLTVRAMPEALTFYTTLGFTLIVGGPQSPFSTLQAGEAFVNLTVAPTWTRPESNAIVSGRVAVCLRIVYSGPTSVL